MYQTKIIDQKSCFGRVQEFESLQIEDTRSSYVTSKNNDENTQKFADLAVFVDCRLHVCCQDSGGVFRRAGT
jgi:hypothetical protein